MEKTITTIVEDSMGLEKGISITNIRVLPERKFDRIIITGRMNTLSRKYTSLEFEPEIQADVLNGQNQICLSSVSHHHGCFFASQKVSFSIEITEVSRYVRWDEISKIELFCILEKKNKPFSLLQN